MTLPEKIATTQLQRINDELSVYNPERDERHTLNATAALVWEHCDGQTDPEALSILLQHEFNMPPRVAEELLWLILDFLGQAHLLREPVTGNRHIYSRRQMGKILAISGLSAILVPDLGSRSPESGFMTLPNAAAQQNTTTTTTESATTVSTTTTEEPEPTPEDCINELIGDVEALNLRPFFERILLHSLHGALDALRDNEDHLAIFKMVLFILKVKWLVRRDEISSTTGEGLIADAKVVIAKIKLA